MAWVCSITNYPDGIDKMTTAATNYVQHIKDINSEKEDWEDYNEQMDFYFTAHRRLKKESYYVAVVEQPRIIV